MNNKPVRILLIEDNPGDTRLIQEMLKEVKNKNFDLKWVDRLSKGLEYLSKGGVDIVLLDLSLPDSQGLETFTSLYAQEPRVPIIILSGQADEALAINAVHEGAQDYLVKGQVDGVLLMRAIHYAIERKKAEKELADAYQRLKETQEQLIQSAKMAAMGQLAAGVSHELNQPLTGIKGFAQAVLMDLKENNPLRGDLNKIIEQANRMDKIIQHVRFFARKSGFMMKELDVNQPIEDSLMLLSQQLKVHNIRLKTSLGRNLPKIRGDSNQLEQVFLNLITNARDAIDSLRSPDGGEIIVESALSKDKKNIEITFKDTGCGIARENLGNIFNPFFTTKSPDGGIGLGLSIVYRIIEHHKGKIEVDSEEGKGTTFKITLPVSYTDEHRLSKQ